MTLHNRTAQFVTAAASALVGAMITLAPAKAATATVLDTGSARACYEAAQTERRASAGISACDAALTGQALSPADRAATYANRSVLRLSTNDAGAALADADMALKLNPGARDAAVTRAGALLVLDRPAEARAALDAAIPHLTGYALERALFNRAIAAEEMGDLRAAYHDYKRAAELNPAFEAAHIELARFQVGK